MPSNFYVHNIYIYIYDLQFPGSFRPPNLQERSKQIVLPTTSRAPRARAPGSPGSLTAPRRTCGRPSSAAPSPLRRVPPPPRSSRFSAIGMGWDRLGWRTGEGLGGEVGRFFFFFGKWGALPRNPSFSSERANHLKTEIRGQGHTSCGVKENRLSAGPRSSERELPPQTLSSPTSPFAGSLPPHVVSSHHPIIPLSPHGPRLKSLRDCFRIHIQRMQRRLRRGMLQQRPRVTATAKGTVHEGALDLIPGAGEKNLFTRKTHGSSWDLNQFGEVKSMLKHNLIFNIQGYFPERGIYQPVRDTCSPEHC